MRRLVLWLGALAFLWLAPLAGAGASQQADATFVAVIDSDGLLTPIAVYDGREWWNRWPWGQSDEIKALPVPRSLAAVPREWLPDGPRFPARWTVLRPSGGRIGVRALVPARRPGDQLMDTIVIRTTFRRTRDEDFQDAAAISGPGRLGRFLAPSRSEARRIGEQIEGTIISARRAASHELERTARSKQPWLVSVAHNRCRYAGGIPRSSSAGVPGT